MSNLAYFQKIDHSIIKAEVITIIGEYSTPNNPIDNDNIDFCMRISSDSNNDAILKGFFEIRTTGNFRRNYYKESVAISNSSPIENIPIDPPFLKGTLHLKHEDFLFLNTRPVDIVLKPRIMNPNATLPSPLKVLVYKISSGGAVLGGGSDLFPSPPATGTFH